MSIVQTSFVSGEWSNTLDNRSDLQTYSQSSRQILNFIPTPQGPLIRRPGTQFLHSDTPQTHHRLIPFSANKNTFLLSFTPYSLVIFLNNQRLLSLNTPWSLQDPIDYVRSGDVMWITCPACRPQTLARYSTTDWRLEPVDLSFATERKYLDGSLVFGNTSEKPRIDECLSADLVFDREGNIANTSHRLQFFLGNRANNQITPQTSKGSLSKNQIAHIPLNPVFKRSIGEISFLQGVTYTFQESDQVTRLIYPLKQYIPLSL